MIKNGSFVEKSDHPRGSGSSSSVEKNISVGGKCAICTAPSTSKCSKCAQIFYCSGNHQKQDWQRHKQECHPFIIKSNERLGRYLVAARDINSDEIVLKEPPLVYGAVEKYVCVGCLKQINQNDFLKCEYCGCPICERECQNCPDHKAECEYLIMQNNKSNSGDFKTYTQHSILIRCLLLKKTNPKKWERLIQLQSHQEPKDLEYEKIYLLQAKYLKKNFKCNEWSEDEIIKIRKILDVNSFEIPLVEPSYAAIFDNASLFEHSCNPNLDIIFTNKNDVILWAPYKIKKGTNLSITYLAVEWGAVRRQQHLKKTKFFKCECERCKDVTEFGTFYNALKCKNKNCDGMVLPLSLETFDEDWKCNKCLKVIKKSYVSKVLDNAEKEFETLDKDNTVHCMRYINDYTKYLSEQHYLICEAKEYFVQFANNVEILRSVNRNQLSTGLKFCKEMIELFEKLAPVGFTETIGTLCFTLHRIFFENSRRTTDRQTSKRQIKESLKYIKITIKNLKYHPIQMAEGKLYARAKLIEAHLTSFLSE